MILVRSLAAPLAACAGLVLFAAADDEPQADLSTTSTRPVAAASDDDSKAEPAASADPDAPAQPPAGKPPASEEGEDDGLQFFTSLDANGDGKLELKEVPKQAQARLKPLFDRLGKSSMTAAELAELRRSASTDRTANDRAAFFDRLDENGDGTLTLKETPARAKRLIAAMLDRAGKPADGTLTKAEFVKLATGNAASQAAAKAPPGLLKVLDTDRDGKLSKAELAAAPSKFAELDADGDGVLESRELFGAAAETTDPATARAAEYAQRVFNGLDKDGNGRISREEAPEIVLENYDAIDEDGNGITFEEFAKAIAAQAGDKTPEGGEEAGSESPSNPE